jgi:pathogenesis-related protein 1
MVHGRGVYFRRLVLFGVTSVAFGCGGTKEEDSAVSPSSSSFENLMLSELNQVRASVQPPANYVGTWAPLPELTWSVALASSAQIWANTLRDQNDCQIARNNSTPYGETLAYGSVGYGASQAVAQWAEDQSTYTFNTSYQGEAGTYLQIVWRASSQVGCATTTCETGWHVFVCYFDPPGNVIGSQPY